MLFDRGLSTLADQREVLADAKLGHYFHCRFTRCRDPSELTISPDDKSHASRQMRMSRVTHLDGPGCLIATCQTQTSSIGGQRLDCLRSRIWNPIFLIAESKMMDLALILLGAVFYGAAGAVVARANPSIPIKYFWKLHSVLPRSYRILSLVGQGLGLFGAIIWRHEIGWWSYLIYVLAMLLSYPAGQILQRRLTSTPGSPPETTRRVNEK